MNMCAKQNITNILTSMYMYVISMVQGKAVVTQLLTHLSNYLLLLTYVRIHNKKYIYMISLLVTYPSATCCQWLVMLRLLFKRPIDCRNQMVRITFTASVQ